MARIAIWLLAVVATANLARATPTPLRSEDVTKVHDSMASNKGRMRGILYLPIELFGGRILPNLSDSDIRRLARTSKESQRQVNDAKFIYFGGEVFAPLRDHLQLPVVNGTANLVGLRTLLESSQLELRGVVCLFQKYFTLRDSVKPGEENDYDNKYPDLFQSDRLHDLTIPSFVNSWGMANFGLELYPLTRIKHGLFKIAKRGDIDRIVKVIETLFEVLNSDDLLNNFQSIAESVLEEQRNEQSSDENSQPPVDPGLELSKMFRAFVYQYWLKVIGGNDIVELRRYLNNLLIFMVIPPLIGQVLESKWKTDALVLAQRISQFPNYTQLVKDYPEHTPNYYEFILLYTMKQQLNVFPELANTIQQAKIPKVELLCKCFAKKSLEPTWKNLEGICSPHLPHDTTDWLQTNSEQCNAITAKYMRSFYFNNITGIYTYYPEGENFSEIVVPRVY